MIEAFLALPWVGALIALVLPTNPLRRAWLPVVAIGYGALLALVWPLPETPLWGGWFAFDAPGKIVLLATAITFVTVAFYTAGYLAREDHGLRVDFREGEPFRNYPERVFAASLCAAVGSISFVAVAQHLGILWVAVEATTLTTAPLIYFHRHHRSLEATWKYLILCSVGIALALVGNFFIALAGTSHHAGAHAEQIPLIVGEFVAHAKGLQHQWLELGFLFVVVGYGTKMGLAPLHTWLPDAYGEAPTVFSTLSSGALLNAAALGIWRVLQILAAAGRYDTARDVLIVLGVLSLATAAAFLLRRGEVKRLLGYSTIENMGLIALGMGLGGTGAMGALLHVLTHGVTKAMLLLTAGVILTAYRTPHAGAIRGVGRSLPLAGGLWLAGVLAVLGTPPFGVFLSKFLIFRAAFEQGAATVGIVALALTGIAFIGLTGTALAMAQGESSLDARTPPPPFGWSTLGPIIALAAVSLALGLFIPPFLADTLSAAAETLVPLHP